MLTLTIVGGDVKVSRRLWQLINNLITCDILKLYMERSHLTIVEDETSKTE